MENNIIETISDVMVKSELNNMQNAEDYIKDGLIHCGLCHTPKQVLINIRDIQKLVYCSCECAMNRYNCEQEKLKSEKNSSAKYEFIPQREMHNWNFKHDDGKNQFVSKIARKYADEWDNMYKENIGLLLFGDVGTGKTYFALCIANALIDKGVPVLVTNFSKIINDMTDFKTGNNNDYLREFDKYSLIVIDDYGAERATSTAIQYIEDMIDSRFRAKKPLIITTNKSVTEMKSDNRIEYKRINSRILSMTIPVEVKGMDRRKTVQSEKMTSAKELLFGNTGG